MNATCFKVSQKLRAMFCKLPDLLCTVKVRRDHSRLFEHLSSILGNKVIVDGFDAIRVFTSRCISKACKN